MPSSDRSPDKPSRLQIGHAYERLAAQYYEDLGFEVLERNWRAGRRELDLIVRRDELVVFVEVKMSSDFKYGHPAERVDRQKIVHLGEAARQFVAERNITGCDFRFDVIAFVKDKLEHFPGAFRLDE